MNVLIRGVRFCLRVGRANCVKNILEPKPDSTDAKEFFQLGDADPDRVRMITYQIFHSQVLSPRWPRTHADCACPTLQITDEEIKEYIREHCGAAFHPVSDPFRDYERLRTGAHAQPSFSLSRRRRRASAPLRILASSTRVCACSASRASASSTRRSFPTRSAAILSRLSSLLPKRRPTSSKQTTLLKRVQTRPFPDISTRFLPSVPSA
jgi:hypothetical protein